MYHNTTARLVSSSAALSLCRCDRALGAATSSEVQQRRDGHQAGPGAVAEAEL